MSSTPIRQRAKHPKTRTGCFTCRERHVKCDEERPSYRRCVRAGRTCLGYRPPKSAASKIHAMVLPRIAANSASTPLRNAPVSATRLSLTSLPPVPLALTLSLAERLALELFLSKTVHQLPGNRTSLSWVQLAQSIGLHDPATIHAATALGSLHRMHDAADAEKNTAHTTSHCLDDFGLVQCNKTISHMRQDLEKGFSNGNVEVIALTSLLLFCSEVRHSRDEHARIHLRSGLHVLYEFIDPARKEACPGLESRRRPVRLETQPRMALDILLQTFVRLDRDLTITSEGPYLLPVAMKEIPGSFLTLEEATVYFDALSASVLEVDEQLTAAGREFVIDQRPGEFAALSSEMIECLASTFGRIVPLDAPRKICSKQLEKVQYDVARFRKALKHLSKTRETEQGHLLLRIDVAALCYETSSWRTPDESHTDDFETQFRDAVGFAERYLELQIENGSSGFPGPDCPEVRFRQEHGCTSRSCFFIGTSFVQSIFLIAFKCRNPALRRRCVTILKRVDLQGVFDAGFVVSLVQSLIAVEEIGIRQTTNDDSQKNPSDRRIPLDSRIMNIRIGRVLSDAEGLPYYKACKGKLIYSQRRSDGIIRVNERTFDIFRGSC